MEKIQNRVLHFADGDSPDTCVAILRSGRANTVFVDMENQSLGHILQQATVVYRKIASKLSLWEPVVVGPLSGPRGEHLAAFGRFNLRTTPLCFSDYVQKIAEHQKFLERVRGRH